MSKKQTEGELNAEVKRRVDELLAEVSRCAGGAAEGVPNRSGTIAILGDAKDGVKNELIDINLEISKIHSLGWLNKAAIFWQESQSGRHRQDMSAALINSMEIILSITDSVRDRIDRLEMSIRD